MAIIVLDYHWDPETWLFPSVPLIPLALEGVQQQLIKTIFICPRGMGAMWWPKLVRTENRNGSNQIVGGCGLPHFPKRSKEELPKMDPLYVFYMKVVI